MYWKNCKTRDNISKKYIFHEPIITLAFYNSNSFRKDSSLQAQPVALDLTSNKCWIAIKLHDSRIDCISVSQFNDFSNVLIFDSRAYLIFNLNFHAHLQDPERIQFRKQLRQCNNFDDDESIKRILNIFVWFYYIKKVGIVFISYFILK